MATNTMGSMLSKPTQAYTRMPGSASGLGQKQPQTCPTGYRYDTTQGKCVAVNKPTPGFWQQVGQGVSSAGQQMTQPTAKAPVPTIAQQIMPKPSKDYSPYANLVAQAIDLNPPLAGGQQPYMQMQPVPVSGGMLPQQGIGQQLAVNPDFTRLVLGR